MATLIQQLSLNMSWSKKSLKFPRKLKGYFFLTMSDLYSQGFSLNESLKFMQLLLPKYGTIFEEVMTLLGQGNGFETALAPMNIGISIKAQIFFAEKQGRFGNGLTDIGKQLTEFENYRKQFLKTITYPIFLSIFLFALLFGVREFMLPQIVTFITQATYDENRMVRLLILFFSFLPQITVSLVAIAMIIYFIIDFWLLKLELLPRYQILVKIPFFSQAVRKYCSYKFGRELAYFYGAGYSLQQTFQMLIQFPLDPFLAAIAVELRKGLLEGEDLVSQISELGIFTEEFPYVIRKGEMTSQVSHQCRIYSDKIFKELMEDIQKKISIVQPILFILIAVLVMAMYLLMMLPMLTMEGI